MKTKVTNKEIRPNYNNILSIGYCEAQFLLRGVSPFGYNCGVYGWNCDFYDIDGICVSTGYRPIGKRVNYSLLKEYEDKANRAKLEEVPNLLKEFISLYK